MAFNVLTLAVSLTALAISTLVSFQQMRLQFGANSHAALAQIWEHLRDSEFLDDMQFILHDLSSYSPDAGISGLPPEARKRVYRVAYFFQQYAFYVGLGILSRQVVARVLRGRIIGVWDAIAPFVEVERGLDAVNGKYLLLMFENLAAYARTVDPEKIGVMSLVRRINPRGLQRNNEADHSGGNED